MNSYDVLIIGAGPAGYVAAIRAAQLGMNTACIERWRDSQDKQALGGTCLNVGCIPSKALLESSHRYQEAQQSFTTHGIVAEKVRLDLAAMMQRKEKIVQQLTRGVSSLFKANKVTSIFGSARLLADKQVEVIAPDGNKSHYRAQHIILAPGSVPVVLPVALPDDKGLITDSTGALAFDQVPEKLGIIGAGIIGLELGSVWQRLGSKVVILEAMEDFLPMVDHQIAREAGKYFKQQGLDIRLGCRVTAAKITGKKVSVSYQKGDQTDALSVDRLVVAVGRKPATENLCAANSGVTLDTRGFIEVDAQCRTQCDGIYAIGDAVRGPMLAHKGSEEGMMVAEWITGNQSVEVNYSAIPNVIYTAPEVAWVGLSEQEARKQGISVRTGVFPFAASGRAMANDDTRGSVKMIVNDQNDRLLGVQIIGQHAGELIAQAVSWLEFNASNEDAILTMFAHPTLAETLHEAAMAASGRALHMINRRQ